MDPACADVFLQLPPFFPAQTSLWLAAWLRVGPSKQKLNPPGDFAPPRAKLVMGGDFEMGNWVILRIPPEPS